MNKKPIWSWRHAIEESGLPPTQRHILQTIANDLSDTGRYTRMANDDLARRTGLSIRTVETHLPLLRNAGWLGIRLRVDGNGFRLGRDLSPRFPAGFTLPTEPAEVIENDQTENASVRRRGSQTATAAPQTATAAPQTATASVSYIDTFPNTLPKTFPNFCASDDAPCAEGSSFSQEAPPLQANREGPAAGTRTGGKGRAKKQAPVSAEGEGSPAPRVTFEEFWTAYPQKKGKARARTLWSKLKAPDRAAAIASLPAYRETDGVRRGFVQQGDTFLSKRTWEDYTQDASGVPDVPRETLIKAAQVCIHRGKITDLARRIWNSLSDIPADIAAEARRIIAAENWVPYREEAYA